MTKTRYLRDTFAFSSDERSLTTHPFFWVGGLVMSLLPVLDAGGVQVCVDRFDPGEVLETIERERVTRAGFYVDRIPSMCSHADFGSRDRSSLRVSNPELLVQEGYGYGRTRDGLEMGLGMSETLGPYWWGRFDTGVEEAPTVVPGGRFTPPLEALQPGVELKVVDGAGEAVGDGQRGEIYVRGVCLTTGLYKTPRDRYLSPDGFLRTGDSGEVVGSRVYFRGRLSDMIKTAGANVAPAEVVAALLELDEIARAHVVGLPDPKRGQVVAAAVVSKPGVKLDPSSVREKLRLQMSSFKVPTYIVVLEESQIPWNEGSNKLRTGELKKLLMDRIPDFNQDVGRKEVANAST